MSLALTTTHEKWYFRRSIGSFLETFLVHASKDGKNYIWGGVDILFP